MSATDLDGADDGTVSEAASTVRPTCARAVCDRPVTSRSTMCLVHTVLAELTP